DFLLFEQPDVTVIVADAARLERNLNLALQILEITTGAVLCVNLVDEAERHGLRVDARQLARDLGIPVVLAAARQGRGIGELLAAIADVATGRFVCRPARASVGEPRLERAVGELERLVRERFPGLGNARWVALRLLEGDARIVEAVRSGRLRELERPARRPEAMP
nr:FeoB small GTPase domain-containing protein [Thermoanaerobaculia bacterium]